MNPFVAVCPLHFFPADFDKAFAVLFKCEETGHVLTVKVATNEEAKFHDHAAAIRYLRRESLKMRASHICPN